MGSIDSTVGESSQRGVVGNFSVVLQQCTNHNVESVNQISVKFCVDIICRLEFVRPFNRIRQVAALAQIALPISVTRLQRLRFSGPRFSRQIGLV